MGGTTRDLTYLGSPYGEGKGEAFILPVGDTASVFQDSMKQMKQNADAKAKAAEEKKKADIKKVEDWSVNYWLGHQGYFQGKVKAIHDKGIELMGKGIDINDFTKPEVRDWYKQQHDVEQESKLSTAYGTLADEAMKMKPEDRAKYTKASLAEQQKFFLEHPDFNENMREYVKGVPRLKTREIMPKEIAEGKDIELFNAQAAALLADPTQVADAKARKETVAAQYKKYLQENLNVNMDEFDKAPDAQKALDEFINNRVQYFKDTNLDTDKIADNATAAKSQAETARHNKVVESQGWQKLKKEDEQFNKANPAMQGGNYPEYIAALMTGDVSAVSDAIARGTFNVVQLVKDRTSGDTKRVVTEIRKPVIVKGDKLESHFNPKSTYIKLVPYDDNGKIKDKARAEVLELYDENGTVNETSMKKLYGMGLSQYSTSMTVDKINPWGGDVPLGSKAYAQQNFGGAGTQSNAQSNSGGKSKTVVSVKKGDVVSGYVFLGGNPNDKNNWKKQ